MTPTQIAAYKNTVGRIQGLFVPDLFAALKVTASGTTAIWTTANNFLLMGLVVTVAGTLAAAGEQVIEILDVDNSNYVIGVFNCFLPAATPVGSNVFALVFPDGYGYLSPAGDAELGVNLSAAMSTGHVCVTAWGAANVFPTP
jgi:hypothetical protein